MHVRVLITSLALVGCSDWGALRARVSSDAARDATVEDGPRADGGDGGGAAPDAAADAAVIACDPRCVAPSDDAQCAGCPVRLIAPLAGRVCGSRTLDVRWDPRGFSAGTVLIELSDQRSFARVLATQVAPRSAGMATIVAPAAMVDRAKWYWRVRPAGGAPSEPWHVWGDAAAAPMRAVMEPVLDRDDNGWPEFFVGARAQDARRGRAWLVERRPREVDRVLTAIDSPVAMPDTFFASAAAPVGDVDGDGRVDYAISATPVRGDVMSPGRGRVWVYRGGSDAAPVALVGEAEHDQFGAVITAAGDLDGDGYGDFAIGAPGVRADETMGCGGYGAAHVYFGEPGFFSARTRAAARLAPSPGQQQSVSATAASMVAGDVDGDGVDDLVVAQRAYNVRSCETIYDDRTGRVLVYRGARGSFSTTHAYELTPPVDSPRLGFFGISLVWVRASTRTTPTLLVAGIALNVDGPSRFRVNPATRWFEASVDAMAARARLDVVGEVTGVDALGTTLLFAATSDAAGVAELWRADRARDERDGLVDRRTVTLQATPGGGSFGPEVLVRAPTAVMGGGWGASIAVPFAASNAGASVSPVVAIGQLDRLADDGSGWVEQLVFDPPTPLDWRSLRAPGAQGFGATIHR